MNNNDRYASVVMDRIMNQASILLEVDGKSTLSDKHMIAMSKLFSGGGGDRKAQGGSAHLPQEYFTGRPSGQYSAIWENAGNQPWQHGMSRSGLNATVHRGGAGAAQRLRKSNAMMSDVTGAQLSELIKDYNTRNNRQLRVSESGREKLQAVLSDTLRSVNTSQQAKSAVISWRSAK